MEDLAMETLAVENLRCGRPFAMETLYGEAK
jgi:hypothetical protein